MFSNVIVLSTVIFVISLVMCYLPSTISSTKFLKKFYPFVTIAAAGFMLAMLLMDFIPHVNGSCKQQSHIHSNKNDHKTRHSLEDCKEPATCQEHRSDVLTHKHADHHDHSDTENIPFFWKNFGFFMAGISFILLLGIDSLLLQHSHCDNEQIINMNDGLNHGPHEHEYCHIHCETQNKKQEPNEIEISKSINVDQNRTHESKSDSTETDKRIVLNIEKKENKNAHDHTLEGSCNTTALRDQKGTIQAIIFIIALSLHSLFEGLAMSSESVGLFEVGIVIHKALESFALGFTISIAEFTKLQKIILMTIYSILTPVGIFINSVLKTLSHNSKSTFCNHLIISTCNGLALGSILFIVCIEMIPPNFHSKGANLIKILTLAGGYLLTNVFIFFAHK